MRQLSPDADQERLTHGGRCFGSASLLVKNGRNEMDEELSQISNLETQISVETLLSSKLPLFRPKIE